MCKNKDCIHLVEDNILADIEKKTSASIKSREFSITEANSSF
jgi:hypothetical protein